MTAAQGWYDCIHGRIESKWKLADGTLSMEITVPVNTLATVYIPADSADAVQEGGRHAARAAGVKFLRMADAAAVYEIGSGQYSFLSNR